MPRRRDDKKGKTPEALRHLFRTLTESMRLEKFREVFSREPECDEELDEFIRQYVVETYNAGFGEWPELKYRERRPPQ